MKILLIAPTIYEKTDVVGLVSRSLYHNLYKKGIEVYVLSNTNGDDSMESDNCYVYHIKSNAIIEFLFKVTKRTKIRELFMTPDYIYHSWGHQAIAKGIELVNKYNIDIIQTYNNPVCSHIVGYNIAKVTHKKWVAQFYDPLYLNPYRRVRTLWAHRKELFYEKLINENASLIIHNTQKMCDIWINRHGCYSQDRVVVLPMSTTFNESLISDKKTSRRPLTISHIGNFYQNRNALPLIKAVARLHQQFRNLESLLTINFIGDVTDNDKLEIRNLHLDNIFHLTGRLSESECVPYYQETDIFIAIDAPVENPEVCFFPSKMLKYFYSEKPIIGVTPKNSVLEIILKEAGHPYFANDDVNGLTSYIASLLNTGSISYSYKKDYWKNFTVENVVNKYSELVENLVRS